VSKHPSEPLQSEARVPPVAGRTQCEASRASEPNRRHPQPKDKAIHRIHSLFRLGMRAWVLLVVFLWCTSCRSPADQAAPEPVRVAAAADLAFAFEALGKAFEQHTGQAVVFSFGSTGLLALQLKEGAPFDVFAAANVSYVDGVVAAGVCDGTTKAPYARGRIALWTRHDGPVPPRTLADLADPRFKKIAIANPDHAPYGQAARDALKAAGLWERVQPRLVLGENVRQTFQFAETGNAETAIVALALVVGDVKNPWTLVDDTLHPPIAQALAVCLGGKNREGGRAFARFVNSDEGRAVMKQYGFLLPGETLAAPASVPGSAP
jgi:molybdate transport system substrate-binding protein